MKMVMGMNLNYIKFSFTVIEIGFNPSSYVIHESAGTITLVVENRSPVIETEVTVQVTFIEEAAKGTSGTCYQSLVNTVSHLFYTLQMVKILLDLQLM